MATTSPIQSKVFPSLADQPRQHFAEFERQVYDHAGSACRGLFDHGHGLLSLVVSDLVRRNLPTNITVVDGVSIVRLRDTLLQPAQPADTATAGAWKAYEARIKKFITFAAASELLTQSLKDVIPQSDRDLLSDPILGLVQYSSLQIMDHLRTQYGVFRATDFLQLISQLEQKVSVTHTPDEVYRISETG